MACGMHQSMRRSTSAYIVLLSKILDRRKINANRCTEWCQLSTHSESVAHNTRCWNLIFSTTGHYSPWSSTGDHGFTVGAQAAQPATTGTPPAPGTPPASGATTAQSLVPLLGPRGFGRGQQKCWCASLNMAAAW